MLTTDTLWFEIAIVSIIFAIGNILMGHFEDQTPKIRRPELVNSNWVLSRWNEMAKTSCLCSQIS
ncbi:MAG: hypothetical protein K2X86_16550 [Cytophagaceae bacterium]|nr:hypothetical protein [Cytophagaceae bacterium]